MGRDDSFRAAFAEASPRALLCDAAHHARLLLRRGRQREIAERAPQLAEGSERVEGVPVDLDAKLQLRAGAVPRGVDFALFVGGRFSGGGAPAPDLLDYRSCLLAFDVSSRESRVRVREVGDSRREEELTWGRMPEEPVPERSAGPRRWRIDSGPGRLGVQDCALWRGRLIATTRSGLHFYDPDTLEPVPERGGLARELEPAAARRCDLHPRIDSESGRLLTYTCQLGATFSSRYEFLELDGSGEPRRSRYEWPGPLLANASGFTKGHYLLPQLPVAFTPTGLLPTSRGLARVCVRDDPGRRLRVHVVPREPARSPLSVVFEMRGFIYHIVNSWEEAGYLVFDAFVSNLNPERECFASGLDPARPVSSPFGGLFRFSVDLVSGKASKHLRSNEVQRADFCCIDEARRGRPYRAAWLTANEPHQPGRSHIVRLATESGVVQRWSWGGRVFLGQPRLVTRAGGDEDGWLVVPLQRSRETQLAIFDSGRIDRGPVAVLGAGSRLSQHGRASALPPAPAR